MSLYVNGRAVTRTDLERNFKTLNDPLRNYVIVKPMYQPPSTVGFASITANEAVYKAGLAQAKIQNIEKKRKLRLIRMALERQRRQRKVNHGPSAGVKPSVPVVRQPAFSHS
jgi:hypothetical protein